VGVYFLLFYAQVEKSQGEIYRLRAKLENTQSENENIQEEFDKIQQALSRYIRAKRHFAISLPNCEDPRDIEG
jgi:predicted RNase H-like nuclease (RuvC/YqgF family)